MKYSLVRLWVLRVNLSSLTLSQDDGMLGAGLPGGLCEEGEICMDLTVRIATGPTSSPSCVTCVTLLSPLGLLLESWCWLPDLQN